MTFFGRICSVSVPDVLYSIIATVSMKVEVVRCALMSVLRLPRTFKMPNDCFIPGGRYRSHLPPDPTFAVWGTTTSAKGATVCRALINRFLTMQGNVACRSWRSPRSAKRKCGHSCSRCDWIPLWGTAIGPQIPNTNFCLHRGRTAHAHLGTLATHNEMLSYYSRNKIVP